MKSVRKISLALLGCAIALGANSALADYHGHGRPHYAPHGHVVGVLPRASISVHFGGSPFYFHQGIWYRPYGPRYIVAAPPFGAVVPVLPPYYTTLWVGGIPYYYANDVYYTWRNDARGYVVTNLPSDAGASKSTPSPRNDDVFAYPKNGQNEQQQSNDRFECHSWANEQTHYDPTQPGGNVAANESADKRADYFRALTACLEGRGYTVK